jgi:hypothetical protein
MPVATIHALEGRYDEARLSQVSNAVQQGLISARVVPAAEISPDDLLITLYETPGENISFGRGLAQRAHISDKEEVAS